MIAEKTGSLIATSARFGGMFAGADADQVEALASYGETIGIAFQLSDDLLDIASESTQSGKTPGTDLREGIPTLPVLYALAGDDADPDAVRLREILAAVRFPTMPYTPRRSRLLRESAAFKQARETVRSYAETARTQLQLLPAGTARHALESHVRLHRGPHQLNARTRKAHAVTACLPPNWRSRHQPSGFRERRMDVGKRVWISYGEASVGPIPRRTPWRHGA